MKRGLFLIICFIGAYSVFGDADGWDIAKLDTARGEDYLTVTEKDVILELNKARSDPARYAELYIKPRLAYFNGKQYREPGKVVIVTSEGKKAVQECYDAMKAGGAVSLLIPSKGMSRAAKDHAGDQGKNGSLGHTGSDNSSPFDRLARYGQWLNTAGENIAYGQNAGRDTVVQLLIDDGVSNRGHRENNLNSAFKSVGTGFGTHKAYGYVTVIDFAGGYKEK